MKFETYKNFFIFMYTFFFIYKSAKKSVPISKFDLHTYIRNKYKYRMFHLDV